MTGSCLRRHGDEGGSPRYMAPEYFHPSERLTEKVDIWAMGCVFIEIFGGPLAHFECQHVQQVRAKLLAGIAPTVPDSFPKPLGDLCRSCLAIDQRQRPSALSAGQVIQKFAATATRRLHSAPVPTRSN
eukprot:GHVT01101177.1.p1 GENE.GHVT01101177.1~~GHVT01101177.1.p1  ORF type:complete len:129 (+),score=30.99 GHVT01101177.1:174-560(+)